MNQPKLLAKLLMVSLCRDQPDRFSLPKSLFRRTTPLKNSNPIPFYSYQGNDLRKTDENDYIIAISAQKDYN